MTEVAIHESLQSRMFPFVNDNSTAPTGISAKRKTPSELRGEQLKRRTCQPQPDGLDHSFNSNSGMVCGVKKAETTKFPRYIDTRVDEVYSVKKSSGRFNMPYGKDNVKATIFHVRENLKIPSSKNLPSKVLSDVPCENDHILGISDGLAGFSKVNMKQESIKVEKCSQHKFLSVAELSLGNEMLSGSSFIDMDRALKGMVPCELPAVSHLPSDSNTEPNDVPSASSIGFSSEFLIPGCIIPLDFSLKTTMRLISSSSVNWCHKLIMSNSFLGITQFTPQLDCGWDLNSGQPTGLNPSSEFMFCKALQSWQYPQSSLPSLAISAMTSVTQGENDFLLRRQMDWKDSFRSLYYMVRKGKCNIFYVYTTQFVAMFVGGEFLGKGKRSCNVYVSQSTRGLRSLLRENEISFSMPLCKFNMEQATSEDLAELSEMQRHNLGQAQRLDFMLEVDNSPQSLLAFIGHDQAHGFYDLMLNYRSFLSSLITVDVPVLYAPVPFQNASLCIPDVKCKEMKKIDAILSLPKAKHQGDSESSDGICYSIEIQNSIIPPWIISGVCAAMGSEGRDYQVSFTTEAISIGLNAALSEICPKSDPSEKDLKQIKNPLSISESIATLRLTSAFLKGLKYSNGSCMASLSPM